MDRNIYIVVLHYVTMKSQVIRVNWRTLQKLRQIFPAKYKESMSSYFGRLEEELSKGSFVNDLNDSKELW